MSREERQAIILRALRNAKCVIAQMCADYGVIEIDGRPVDPDLLAASMDRAIEIAQSDRPVLPPRPLLPELIDALKTRAAIIDFRTGDGHVPLRSWERDQICIGYELLTTALAPFAEIASPPCYANDLAVTVEVKGTQKVAQSWQREWDDCEASGTRPLWLRPDIENGQNFPIQLLSNDGISIGDIRYAASAMRILTPEVIPVQQCQKT